MPFDIHPIVLYYNKDMLAAAGLIGDDGLPTGSTASTTSTRRCRSSRTAAPSGLSTFTADGNFQFRTIYSLLGQQDGELMTDGELLAGDNLDKLQRRCSVSADWMNDGCRRLHRLSRRVALFTSGKAAMIINGVWEVPTMTDLAAQGKLLRVGRDRAAGPLRPSLHLRGLACLRDPDNAGKKMTPEKRAAVLEVDRPG